jgi:hypothetical protein
LSTQSTCQDDAGNVWQATCVGSTCSCSLNGSYACTCTMTTPIGQCNSCCPGSI